MCVCGAFNASMRQCHFWRMTNVFTFLGSTGEHTFFFFRCTVSICSVFLFSGIPSGCKAARPESAVFSTWTGVHNPNPARLPYTHHMQPSLKSEILLRQRSTWQRHFPRSHWPKKSVPASSRASLKVRAGAFPTHSTARDSTGSWVHHRLPLTHTVTTLTKA